MSVTGSTPEKADFFLLDLAFDKQALRQLYEACSRPDYEPLYRGTPFQNVMLEGPVLVRPVEKGDRELLETKCLQGDLIGVQAPGLSLDEMAEYLRQWLRVKTPEGSTAVFRLADPRLYPALLPSLEDHERNLLLGPAQAFFAGSGESAWTLLPVEGRPVEPLAGPFPLRWEHLKALQQWREDQLLSDWAGEMSRSKARLANWFQHLKAAGVGSEYDIWYACQRLSDRGFDRNLEEADTRALMATEPRHEDLAAWADGLAVVVHGGEPA